MTPSLGAVVWLTRSLLGVCAGKTWTSALHITPLGVSAVDGGSFDYSALAQEPMMDDPSVGGLLWAHQRPGAACNTNPPPAGCFEILFTRFALDF